MRGPLDLVKEQWEEVESHPVSVADYLSAEKRDKEAKEHNTKHCTIKAREREVSRWEILHWY